MKRIAMLPIGLVASLGIALFVVACSQATPTPTATLTPMPTSTSTPPAAPAAMAMGGMLYQQTCAACHGSNAEGTGVAPSIAGHGMTGLKTQVRNPVGTMPRFTPAMLSDGDLDEVAAYIASLGAARAPVMDWEMAAPETIHHWMALLAIKQDDLADSRHHLEDALAFVKEPAKEANMKEAIKLISEGNAHDAEHEIEEMAGAESPSGITMPRFHLILAQEAIEDDDAEVVEHHLEHFLLTATEEQKPVVMEALELVEKGDLHEAEHEVEELLEMAG